MKRLVIVPAKNEGKSIRKTLEQLVGEDADYGLRVHEAGLKVGVCAGAVLRHHHEQAGRVFDYHHNKEYLWKKHRL